MIKAYYYDTHALEFAKRTDQLDLSSSYKNFLPLLPERAKILDAGYERGQDAAYFLD